jgi:hypothetical protein
VGEVRAPVGGLHSGGVIIQGDHGVCRISWVPSLKSHVGLIFFGCVDNEDHAVCCSACLCLLAPETVSLHFHHNTHPAKCTYLAITEPPCYCFFAKHWKKYDFFFSPRLPRSNSHVRSECIRHTTLQRPCLEPISPMSAMQTAQSELHGIHHAIRYANSPHINQASPGLDLGPP